MNGKPNQKPRARACCTPSGDKPSSPTVPEPIQQTTRVFSAIQIPGGPAILGTKHALIPDDGESPLRKKRLKPFRIAPTTVTNAEFAEFVADTGYQTEAERIGWSFVFWSDVSSDIPASEGVHGFEWWRKVDGANWRDINGPGTQASAQHADHPVVHVSWNDALAYATWAGGRLPTEAEWEHAARGGLQDSRFPWGETEPSESGPFACNIWQGRFPDHNSAADGWKTTAPARSFEANGYGLYNTMGNVWEWTADLYRIASLKKSVKARLKAMAGFRTLKGGSFLCHKSYCYRYRIAARTGNSPDSSTTHQGFRMVWDS